MIVTTPPLLEVDPATFWATQELLLPTLDELRWAHPSVKDGHSPEQTQMPEFSVHVDALALLGVVLLLLVLLLLLLVLVLLLVLLLVLVLVLLLLSE